MTLIMALERRLYFQFLNVLKEDYLPILFTKFWVRYNMKRVNQFVAYLI